MSYYSLLGIKITLCILNISVKERPLRQYTFYMYLSFLSDDGQIRAETCRTNERNAQCQKRFVLVCTM